MNNNDHSISSPADQPNFIVGYGKPPQETRFKKGQSGNKKGRPKGAKNKQPTSIKLQYDSDFLKEAYRLIKVNDGDEQIHMSMKSAIIRSLGVAAAKGRVPAQRLYLEELAKVEQREKRRREELLFEVLEYKESYEKEFARCDALGIKRPEPIPHPDHLIINTVTGEVDLIGPLTKEQKAENDYFREQKAFLQESIAEQEKLLRRYPNHKLKDCILEDLARERKRLKFLEEIVPD